MTKPLSFIVLLFLLSSLTGCDKSGIVDHGSEVTNSTIMPLAIGNVWRLKCTQTLPDSTRIVYDSIYLLNDTIIQAQRSFRVDLAEGTGPYQSFLNIRPNGLYIISVYDSMQFTLLFKCPAEIGDQYDSWGGRMTVLSTTDTVQVPAGKFICYHYTSGYAPNYFSDYWYAPNIGFVKEEDHQFLSTKELIGYILN